MSPQASIKHLLGLGAHRSPVVVHARSRCCAPRIRSCVRRGTGRGKDLDPAPRMARPPKSALVSILFWAPFPRVLVPYLESFFCRRVTDSVICTTVSEALP